MTSFLNRRSSHLKQWLAALTVALVACLAANGLTYQFTLIQNLEKLVVDLRVAGLQPAMPQSNDIVIAAITEETLAMFPYRSPVDRGFLAGLLLALQAKGAKAIGLDVLLDSPTEESKDQQLAQTLREMKTPLFVSYTVTPSIVNEEQLAYLNAFVPQQLRAAANLATDPVDGAVRWIYPGETEPGMPVSFPRKAAELLGIPTPNEQPVIAWRPRPDLETPAFAVYPAHAVAVMPEQWFRDKLVLVGAVLSITDRHRTPLAILDDGDDGRMPGILIHAHAISQLLEGRTAHQFSPASSLSLAFVVAALGATIGLMKRGILFSVLSGLFCLVLLWLGALLGFYKGLVPMVPVVAPSIALALSLWMMDALLGRAERRKRQFVQGAFSRYVSPEVVKRLVETPESLTVSGVRQDTSFIFSDIAGFTTLSETLPSDELSAVLNDYLDGACAVVFKHAGTVDKFIGDAIMAVFNAPVTQPDHVARAVRCALDLDSYCEDFRKRMNAKGIAIGVTRIGIHTGPATVGNFGSHARMDFTALGDTVNIASRTEGVNKYFGTRICVTEDVVAQCPDLHFLPIGQVVLKGKTSPVGLFTPVNAVVDASEFAIRYRANYNNLLLLGESAGSFESGMSGQSNSFDAKVVDALCREILKLAQDYPDEPLAQFHAKRARQGLITARVVMEDK